MGPRVPDAWDDDFEQHADTKQAAPSSIPARQTKAERRAQHAEAQRALWASADRPTTEPAFHLLGSSAAPPPLASGFKPPVTLLSRKPKADAKPAEDEPDSEEEERRDAARAMQERTEQARREREEKARRYAEVRSRLFGEDETPAAAPASPVRGTQRQGQGQNGGGRGHRGGKGRGGRGGGSSNGSTRNSSADPSPARTGKVLFDPEYSPKPGSGAAAAGRDGVESPVMRQPRGPDGAGRGFARRGGEGS